MKMGISAVLKALYFRLPLSPAVRALHLRVWGALAPRFMSEQGFVVSKARLAGVHRTATRVRSWLEALDHRGSIALPTSGVPRVSVVIPVHGQWSFTLRCLNAIALSGASVPFEVLVVDDASPDGTARALSAIEGIRVVTHTQNEGFIRSCNKGASAAKGEYLLFLNNDTVVLPGWLDALVDTFADIPGTGMVGSRLVFPDGTLQEAGGVVWEDGTPWMVGRFQDADLPVYHYAREVDYCSGASLMIPKALFDELGGFDERYVPAYCEDADLGLKVREKGYRVVYQPFSTVVHYEGASNGRSLHTGVKAYQVANIQKLRAYWSSRLGGQGAGPRALDWAKDRGAKWRALFLTGYHPQEMVALQRQGCQVTWFPGEEVHYPDPRIEGMQRVGVEVLYRPFETSVEQHLRHRGARYRLLVFDDETEPLARLVGSYCPGVRVVHWLSLAELAE